MVRDVVGHEEAEHDPGWAIELLRQLNLHGSTLQTSAGASGKPVRHPTGRCPGHGSPDNRHKVLDGVTEARERDRHEHDQPHLPVDELKIDRSFIQALSDHGDTALVEAIIKLSHDFDLTTVAEGIEDEDQVASLIALGCDTGQGYLLGRPGPASAMEGRLGTAGDRATDALPLTA